MVLISLKIKKQKTKLIELFGSQILPVRPAADSDPESESQKSVTAEKIHPQELGKNLRVPVIRWGGMCTGEKIQVTGRQDSGASHFTVEFRPQ